MGFARYLSYDIKWLVVVCYYTQGSHRSPKVLNVLEFDFSIRVPSNVLEFHWMFLNVLE